MVPRARGAARGVHDAWWLAAIFALAFLLRAALVVQYERSHPFAESPIIDEASYERWALEIAAGDWLGDEVFFQEPLYPYWLGSVYAVFGHERTAARMLQAILGAATACAVYGLALRVFGRPAAIVAGFAMATYRPALLIPALFLKPNLFLPVFAVLALALLATRSESPPRAAAARWVGVGLLTGLGALLRGNMLMLLPCIALWPFARVALRQDGRHGFSRAAGHSAAAVLGMALVLLPVALRNASVGDPREARFALTTSGAGTNLYGGNNPQNPYGIAKEFDWVRTIPEHEEGDWRHEAERRLGRELDASEVSAFWFFETLKSVRANPALHARILWNKLRVVLASYEVPDNQFLEWDARYVPLLRAPLQGFGLWGWAGLAGIVFALFPRGRPAVAGYDASAARELALLLGLYAATIVLTVSSMRVRMALVPLLLPFAGFLFVRLVSHARGGLTALRAGGKRTALAVGVLAASALAVHAPVFPEGTLEKDLDERDFNLAVHCCTTEGALAQARAIGERLDARYPGTPRVVLLLADIDYRAGREILDRPGVTPADLTRGRAGVESAVQRLRSLAPESLNAQEQFRADVLSGAIHQYLSAWAPAAVSYRAALAFDPDDADVLRRLAVCLAEEAMQRTAEARALGLAEAEVLLVRCLELGESAEVRRLLEKIREQLALSRGSAKPRGS